MLRPHNTDGIVNCLRQAGQLRYDQKTYASEFNATYKTFGTVTTPAPETMPLGLPSDKQMSWFLHRHLDNFIMTQNLTSVNRDLVPLRQFHRDTKLIVHLPGLAKTSPAITRTATYQTARPLVGMHAKS